MKLKKYKYYFKKPRSEIAKDILLGLMLSGMIVIAASSPYFIRDLWRAYSRWKKYPRKKFYDMFYVLRKRGFLDIRKEKNQIYFSLTEEGKKKAGWLQVDSLEIKRPKYWDRQWRLIIFDIAELKKVYREAFRGKLKELGFYQLQKSVWVCPFDCEAEVELLRDFFGLNDQELRVVTANHIGPDHELKKHFNLS